MSLRYCLPALCILFAVSGFLFAQGSGSANVPLLANVDQYSSVGYNDVWGYTAPDGREYALLGVQNGTSVIDITDTNIPNEIGFIPSATSLWKDIKTYQHYAYVVNESNGGMQILDLSDLPNSVSLAATYTGFSTSHNIFIDVPNGILYAEGSGGVVVRILDLVDPLSPVEIASLGIECHDIMVWDDLLVVSEGGSGSFGFWDVANPASPAFITRVNVPAAGYCHNAWISEDGNYMMTTEETTGKTVKTWDISDLGNITLTDENLGSSGLAHNAHIKGKFSYVSHYADGMEIYDFTDPTNVVRAGFYDTFPGGGGGFSGSWGAYPFFQSGKVLISDQSTGLYVVYFAGAADLKPADPTGFTAYSDYNTPNGMTLEWENPTKLITGDTLTEESFSTIILRNDVEIGSVVGTANSYTDTGLNDGQKYNYQILARVDSTGFESEMVFTSWTAGGAKEPQPATQFSIAGNQTEITVSWTSPSANIDGTPMDDYAGINLYQNDNLVATFARTSGDTASSDQETYSIPTPGYYGWKITVIDDESPQNESVATELVTTPLGLPIADDFAVAGPVNSGLWLPTTADINVRAANPPSGITALNLNGAPHGGETVELRGIDLSGSIDPVFSYYYQPQGTGNAPEEGDSLMVYFKNSVDDWVKVRAYPGTTSQPFQYEQIAIASEPSGNGTFLHGQFQVRFRNIAGASAVPNDDWFIDNVIISEAALGIDDDLSEITSFKLIGNYPNPFNPSTTIRYSLAQQGNVTLTVFNTLGQQVRTLVSTSQNVGSHETVWNGLDDAGQQVGSGVYFYRLEADNFVQSRKMMLLK
ncbi:MAG: choice-of-anchor B family protein [Calditrichia bacterium]